jgi:hypothetical protein
VNDVLVLPHFKVRLVASRYVTYEYNTVYTAARIESTTTDVADDTQRWKRFALQLIYIDASAGRKVIIPRSSRIKKQESGLEIAREEPTRSILQPHGLNIMSSREYP